MVKGRQGHSPVKKGGSSPPSPKQLVKTSPQKLSDNINSSDNESPRKRGRKRKSSESEAEKLDVQNSPLAKPSPGKKAKLKKDLVKAINFEAEINIPPTTKHNLEEAVIAVVEAAAQAGKVPKSPSGKRGRPKTKVGSPLESPSKVKDSPGKRGRPKTKDGSPLESPSKVKSSPGKRGIPPKAGGEQAHSDKEDSPLASVNDSEHVADHKRGRPLNITKKDKQGSPKINYDSVDVKAHSPINSKGAGSSPRKRGRPPSDQPKAIPPVNKFPGKRGRPLKDPSKPAVVKFPKIRKRGRPRKETRKGYSDKRGRPRKVVETVSKKSLEPVDDIEIIEVY